jgi:hypothetical protein
MWVAACGLSAVADAAEDLATPSVPAVREEGVKVHLRIGGPAERGGLVAALGGSTLSVSLLGPARAAALWALAHRETVLQKGRVDLDETGTARLLIAVPRVRHRTVCRLAARAGEAVGERDVVVYPVSALAASAERLRHLRVGVHDPGGRVQKALAAEGVACEDLEARIARDFFNGGLVILAGHDRAETLQEECRRLETRLRDGMTLILLNPPAGWAAWGVTCADLDSPLRSPVQVAEPLASAVPGEDLGAGPWKAALEVAGEAAPLVWVEAPKPSSDRAGRDAPSRRLLAVARPVGRGSVIVSALPQTLRSDTDALGRAIFDGLVLWSLDRSNPRDKQGKETGHD